MKNPYPQIRILDMPGVVLIYKLVAKTMEFLPKNSNPQFCAMELLTILGKKGRQNQI